MRILGMGVLIAGVSLAIPGCCAPVKNVDRVAAAPRDVLFGGEFPAQFEGFVERNEWPSTTGFTGPGEQVDYQETVLDIQGRGFSDHDWLYRRFDSVRTGRGTR